MRGRFNYELQALLTKQRWDVDALMGELSIAQAAVAQAADDAQHLAQAVSDLDKQLADARREGAVMDPARESLLRSFRSMQAELCDRAKADLEKAREQREQINGQLLNANARLRGYEQHRERARKAYEFEQQRASERESDEAWLLRRKVEVCGDE